VPQISELVMTTFSKVDTRQRLTCCVTLHSSSSQNTWYPRIVASTPPIRWANMCQPFLGSMVSHMPDGAHHLETIANIVEPTLLYIL
jgi:hypothetical protein